MFGMESRSNREIRKENDVNLKVVNSVPNTNPDWERSLLCELHKQYCKMFLFKNLPADQAYHDPQRMVLLNFLVSTLDLLDGLTELTEPQRDSISQWVYRLYIPLDGPGKCGFQASTLLPPSKNLDLDKFTKSYLFSGHITATYAALVSLLTLGDALIKLDREKLLKSIGALQNNDGSFKAGIACEEADMRFTYCAVCVCYILNDFSYIDVERATAFIKRSLSYEGSFHSGKAYEGHAAYTFCAVASLYLMDKLDEALDEKARVRLEKWCFFRLDVGFQGRPNKSADTCYSWWVGATLKLLDRLKFGISETVSMFLFSNQNIELGGIKKGYYEDPDPMHTFFGVASLSLLDYPGIGSMHPALTMTARAASRMKELHSSWKM